EPAARAAGAEVVRLRGRPAGHLSAAGSPRRHDGEAVAVLRLDVAEVVRVDAELRHVPGLVHVHDGRVAQVHGRDEVGRAQVVRLGGAPARGQLVDVAVAVVVDAV